jgi:uncharacterized protein (DUF2132 family)
VRINVFVHVEEYGAPARWQNWAMPAPALPPSQPRNPLHGLTLEAILNQLVAHYGWDGVGQRIPVRCFVSEPSIASSLKFLRKTPWARDKVEGLYLFMLREARRAGGSPPRP